MVVILWCYAANFIVTAALPILNFDSHNDIDSQLATCRELQLEAVAN